MLATGQDAIEAASLAVQQPNVGTKLAAGPTLRLAELGKDTVKREETSCPGEMHDLKCLSSVFAEKIVCRRILNQTKVETVDLSNRLERGEIKGHKNMLKDFHRKASTYVNRCLLI